MCGISRGIEQEDPNVSLIVVTMIPPLW